MASPAASSSSHTLDDDPEDGYVDRLLILFASETGNTQDAAERVGREIRRRGSRCVVQSMDRYDVTELPHEQLVVFMTSTHGRGDPPPSMMPLWTALLRASLPDDVLEGVNFALFGLGDSSYERFAYAGKLLHRRLVALGAEPLIEATYSDERAPDGMEQTFLPWLESLAEVVTPYLQPPSIGSQERDRNDLGEPIYRIEFLESEDGGAQRRIDDELPRRLNGIHMNGFSQGEGNASEVVPVRREDGLQSSRSSIWKPDDWGWATLRSMKRVTKQDWWQDVREIELELDDPDHSAYLPASIANLQPAMSTEEVDDFLDEQDLLDIADKPFYLHSAIPDQPLASHLPPATSTTTLRRLLTYHVDIRCSPRKSFFEWLRRLSADEREQERLDDFLADPDEIHTYATRPSRTILETLADFRQVKIPLSHLLEILPPLRRRQFSIASSYDSHPGRVQLLIAIVEYRTNLVVPRCGLCSSWLKELASGTRIAIKVSPPTLHLPEDITTPVILVGPGTGVAPMRALLEERVRQGAAKDTVLYFGCRSLSSDHYYASEWDRYRQEGARIRVAASRDGPDKVYVQDLIREDGEMLNDCITRKGAYVYICGSSNTMPKEVREALARCISTAGSGNLSEKEAREYIEAMFENGRGGEETW